MNRQIPGYYYDEIKKKYFKIQPNHTVPSGSAYSVDGVKKRQTEEDAALALAKKARLRKNQIRRAPILQDPLLGGNLVREQGHGAFLDVIERSYTQGWDGQEILESEGHGLDPGSEISRWRNRRDGVIGGPFNASTVAMGDFDWDPVTRHLFSPLEGRILFEVPERKHKFDRSMGRMLCASYGSVSSININHTARLLLTTWLGPAGHNIYIGKISSLRPFEQIPPMDPSKYFLVSMTETYNFGGIPDLTFNPLLHSTVQGAPCIFLMTTTSAVTMRITDAQGQPPTLWAAIQGRSASSFTFTIATSDGIILIDRDTSRHSWISLHSQKEGLEEAVAVETLAQSPEVVLAGCRSGAIRILDVRLPQIDNYASIEHPSTVSKIKQINEHQIIVSGLHSTLCNYDLRFCKREHLGKSLWSESSMIRGRTTISKATSPILLYREHSNAAHVDLGFDIDPETGIAAAVQDDQTSTVKIFSLKSGTALRSLDATHMGSSVDLAPVKAIRFVHDRGDSGMKSLWIAKGTKIIRYAW